MTTRLLIYMALLLTSLPVKAELLLQTALDEGLRSNSELLAAKAKAQAEDARIGEKSFLDNPHAGLMQEYNMTPSQQQMGPMNLWSVSQTIKFPTKYFLLGDAQEAQAKSADAAAAAKSYEIRQKIISSYYQLYSTDRITALLQAQKETLREIARIAEAKHSTGKVPQQDEMKAHVEQTMIEKDILRTQEDRVTIEAELNSLISRNPNEGISFPKKELQIPELKLTDSEIQALAPSGKNQLKQSEYMVSAAQAKKTLAGWDYAPDFNLNFKKAFTNAPQDNYAIGVEVSIPLWFFEKQSNQFQASHSELIEAQKNYETTRRKTFSGIRSLITKTRTHLNLLKIYETSLIPQATSALNSSRGAYRAGRSSFQDLLDSERSLYTIRISYYQTLAEYVENLTKLEETVGANISTLPLGAIK